MKHVDMSLSKRRKKRKSMSKQLKTPKTYKKVLMIHCFLIINFFLNFWLFLFKYNSKMYCYYVYYKIVLS